MVTQWKRTYMPVQKMQETWVQSLDQEDPLEKEMVTYFSILACCLGNSTDREAWGAIVHGVSKSQIRLSD